MSRFLWLSLIFCVAISLIWWPGAKNEASIFELIERERYWQLEHLGFDLVDSIDSGLQSIQSILLTSPIPAGGDSTLAYSVGETDHELQAATHRIAQQPYFQVVIGRIGEREIDFVAESSDGFTYFQVAMSWIQPLWSGNFLLLTQYEMLIQDTLSPLTESAVEEISME